ncbi:MAG: hypothetical protein EOP43_03425 [Sphingobacteriaceae bacterium]|nr:MAG: hypothetical protein EOP43_03425 [Sphingobacteriaceae bacterium]
MGLENDIKPASREEIFFIRDKAPRGMWKLIEIRTGRTRAQVLYQIKQMPDAQDLVIIQAAREILKAVTGEVFDENKTC